MAIDWGPYESSGGLGIRVGIDVSVEAISHNETGATFTVDYYTQNQHSWSDSQQLNLGGAIGGSISFPNNGGDGAVVKRGTRTYTYNYAWDEYGSSPGTKTFSATLVGAFNGITPSNSHTQAIPARPVGLPAPPTQTSADRNSDNTVRVGWINHDTVGEPYGNIYIERFVYGHSDWTRIGNISGSIVGYTDAGAGGNRKYTYRVQAHNSVGESAYDRAGIVWTTPAAPSGCTRTASGANQRITWTNNCDYSEFETQVWHAVDGVWDNGPLDAVNGSAYTHVAPDPTRRHKYRVRAKTTSGQNLFSDYSAVSTESDPAAAVSTPNPPTNLSPASDVTVNEAAPIVLSWTYNPTDASAQTAYIVRHREVGAATWVTVTQVNSAGKTYSLPANTYAKDKRVEWQVQTAGASGTMSAFSASATFFTQVTVTTTITKYPLFMDIITGQIEADSQGLPGPTADAADWYSSSSQPIANGGGISQVTGLALVGAAPTWGHLSGSNVVIDKAGTYLVTGSVTFAANTAGRRLAAIVVNGTEVRRQDVGSATIASNPATVTVSTLVEAALNDTIGLWAFQNGAASNLLGNPGHDLQIAPLVTVSTGGGGGGTGGAPTGAAGGDLIGSYPNPLIASATFSFATASTLWSCPHNLGKQEVLVYTQDNSNVEQFGDVTRVNANLVEIRWYNPMTGLVRISK
jgi:hypothetical protein